MPNIEKFEELLRTNEDAQAQLRAAIDAYEGDKTNDQAYFEATIGKVAEELGFSVTYEEAKTYAGKMIGLDDAELDAVAGGIDFCYIVGGNDEPDHGDCLGTNDWATGLGACGYVGTGLFTW